MKLKECFSWTCTIAHVYLLHRPCNAFATWLWADTYKSSRPDVRDCTGIQIYKQTTACRSIVYNYCSSITRSCNSHHVSIIFLPRYYHYILSAEIVPYLSLRDSLSPLLWKLSLGVFLRFTFRERSSIIHTCTSTVLGMNTPCQSPHTPVSIHTVTWQRPHTPVSFACANCWPY